ncbi:hypothetical protein BU14_0208s0025 [Porphyra umbilicalis]|uniref:C2H2-type domain-containing protein n=1 Tax=Porphyra umbilicalis TaxID=2786 RepID=A0A1X6P5E8_PORUM|nr:hypothetical protein BU14_0208s0025 [Porphyra umbilicalis]|eukprot:OSX76067.1 hypothetical protein BU14_0208s0025 [Porphyra umbilicalis]
MAPHIQCPYATCSRKFGGANGLHRHMQVHHHEHMYVADAVLTDPEGPVQDPDDDGDSGGDAGCCAGASGAAGNVPAGGADDGGDADPNAAGGGWSSSSRASTTTTDDDEGPQDERAWSSGWSTSESDDGSDSTQPVTDSDDDYESTDDTLAPHSRAADNRPNVNSVFVHSLRAQAPVEMHGEMDYGASLSGRVLAWYHALRDADRAEPVFSGRGAIADLPRFDTPCLRRAFTYVCTANGSGLGREQAINFYAVLSAVERGAGGGAPFAERFPSKTAFWKAVRNEKRRTVEALGWRSAPIVIADKTRPSPPSCAARTFHLYQVTGFDRLHFFPIGLCALDGSAVVDVGLCRRISTEVHLYAELVDDDVGLAKGTAAASLRSANRRFMYASRTNPVPHVTPGYVS